MKILKHFIKVTKYLIVQSFCKHPSFVSSSCPFTGNTYTYCEKCGTKTKVEKTNG